VLGIMMATASTRKVKAELTPDDLTLCSIDVTPGRAVYWHNEQREGVVHDVPKHIAMDWLTRGIVAVVYEPPTTGAETSSS
jgi:hypothetical protein